MTSPDHCGHEMSPSGDESTDFADAAIPNVARMWDYYLGGTDNSELDREAARIMLDAIPDIPLAALENREFLKHAIRFLAEESRISQFIDIGSGLPTQGNVHQIARSYIPDARVVYVDNDPVVLQHGRDHLEHVPGVTLIEGDLRQPDSILANPDLRRIIDFSQPVGLCATLVLHFISDAEDPYGIVTRLRTGLPAASYVAISHVNGDEHDDQSLQVYDRYQWASAPLIMRSQAQFLRFFEGFELVEPGVVFLSQWRPATSYYAGSGTRWAYCGVGRKTTPRGKASAASGHDKRGE